MKKKLKISLTNVKEKEFMTAIFYNCKLCHRGARDAD